MATIYYMPGKKKPMIIINGYAYYLNKRTEHTTYWLCKSYYRKCKCNAKVKTSGSKAANITNQHNHPPPSDMKITSDTPFTIVKLIYKNK